MGSAFNSVAIFLINTLFDFYTVIVILRLLLHFHRANFFNPLCQLTVKLTNPIVKPLQKFLPIFQGLDLAVLVLLLLIEILKVSLLAALSLPVFPQLLGLLLWSILEIIEQFIKFYTFAIIGRIVLSWFHNPNTAAIAEVVNVVTEPLLGPARRWIPPISGFDLSPMIVILLLQVISILLGSFAKPLMQFLSS